MTEKHANNSDEMYLWSSLVNNIPDYVFLIGRNGRAHFINREPEMLTREEVLTERFYDFFQGKHREKLKSAIKRTFDTGENQQIVVVFTKFAHDYRWLEMRISPVNDGREVKQVFLIIRDITEEQRYESELEYHAQLVDWVSDSIISTNAHMMIRTWNAAAEDLYGWAESETVGKHIGELIHVEYVDASKEELLATLMETGHWSGHIIHKRKDGTHIHILSSIRAIIKDGQLTGTVSINRPSGETCRIHA